MFGRSMDNLKLVFVLLGVSSSFASVVGRGNGHGHHDTNVTPDPGVAIEHGLDMHHWNDKLCLEILLVDCSTYISTNDEKICATNGVEYPDHCRFAHARCTYLHSSNHIEVANHGACIATTAAPVTTSASPTNAPVSDVQTTPQMITTTTTQMAPTTTNPIHGIMQNVFCQNIDTINCQNMALEVVCGSDSNNIP